MQYLEDVLSQTSDHDGCGWALKKFLQGVEEEEYLNIHVDAPLAAVEALKRAGVGPGLKPFNFVHFSGASADTGLTSRSMWMQGKVRFFALLHVVDP